MGCMVSLNATVFCVLACLLGLRDYAVRVVSRVLLKSVPTMAVVGAVRDVDACAENVRKLVRVSHHPRVGTV